MTTRPLTLTDPDRTTIGQLLASRNATAPEARTLADLVVGLSESVVVHSSEISPTVVTLNSRVRIRTLGTGAERVLTLVAGQSDLRAGRVSVFAPIGGALLGRREGDVVACDVPAGRTQFQIEAVLYQPEAAGAERVAA
ncbi:GreA/GreB family elongation factor [Rubrivirga sp. S365]|uniref:GreA/GreB family elongation factor n=1 Tax=Rubrivirga litoralis TaxID=3075598 RepID=A0ABU3BU08_9BACT|nr:MULTISPECIES: GreA/GreB family elongation factor [unclassified Rubrivirga]MDT0632777.1 GreA/GreB family elongation factor [Rubrivirga sp. F394]MDT7855183.1 GreA/GreB family elongation factor [Rubrivirga sp. S365]